MSRGYGILQRWLLANLPPSTARGLGTRGGKPQARQLAAKYFHIALPTAAQVSSVRRALRGLEAAGRVEAWSAVIRRHGDPTFWSLPGDPAPLTREEQRALAVFEHGI